MATEGRFNPKRQGALIALAKAQRARELMQIFKRYSNIKKNS